MPLSSHHPRYRSHRRTWIDRRLLAVTAVVVSSSMQDGSSSPEVQAGEGWSTRALQQIQHGILLHELGHGYTLTWPIATTSNDEAIADLFSGWAAVKVLNDPGALLGLAVYRELIAKIINVSPALAAWNRAQGYEDLLRLYHSDPRKYRAIGRLIPDGSLGVSGSSFGDFTGGPGAVSRTRYSPSRSSHRARFVVAEAANCRR